MILELVCEEITSSNLGFVVPDAAVADLGGGRRPKVVITLEGVTWRGSLAPMGGRTLLGITKANRAATGVAPGIAYPVEIVLDTEERTVDVPDDLAAALASDPERKAAWEGWSYTRRKEAASGLTGAKQQATRERRLAKLLGELGG